MYPDRDIIYIFDTTGKGRKNFELPIYHLGAEMDLLVLSGCLNSLLNRLDHPNLNGIGDVDLDAPEPERNPFDTNDMNLTQFVNYLWLTRGKTQTAFIQSMNHLGQTAVFSRKGKIWFVITSYKEGKQHWNSIWGRQNRKCVHALIDGKWKLVKSGLEVGAEVKIDPSMGDQYVRQLSSFQEAVRKALFYGKELPAGTVITAKKDGALIQITNITENVEVLYEDIMSADNDNEFVKMLAKESYERSEGKYFLVISTNGTWYAAEKMWDYIVTAVACDFEISQSQLEKWMHGHEDNREKILKVWERLVGDFLRPRMPVLGLQPVLEEVLRKRHTPDGGYLP